MGTEDIKASVHIAQALKIDPDDDIILSKSLIYADTHFCIYNTDFIDRSLLDDSAIDLLENGNASVYQVMYEGTKRTVAWDSMELVVTDNLRTPELSKHMQSVPGMIKPFLVQQVISYDAQNAPMFYSEIYFDPDYFRFGLVRKVNTDLDDYRRESY